MMKLENKTNFAVPERSQVFFRKFRYVFVVVKNVSAVGLAKRSDYLKQGGFTSSAGTNNRIYFPKRNFEVNAFQNLKGSKRFFYVFGNYQKLWVLIFRKVFNFFFGFRCGFYWF